MINLNINNKILVEKLETTKKKKIPKTKIICLQQEQKMT